MNRSLLVLLVPSLFASLTALATANVSGAAKPIISIEGVTEYRLANGLQVLLYPDESSSTVTVNVTYRVGSRQESYGETGMAHLLEHLNFKGTPTHRDIPAEISAHGASANANTSYDRTMYYETLPAIPKNLNWALKLEADRMVHSFIAKKDLDSEMTVVRNEFEMYENNPVRILNERVLETAYIWHNYGHPTIGARSDIEHVPIARLQAFYHTYYQPDNATLIVTGKFAPHAALALIERTYGAIPKPKRILPSLYTAEPAQDGEREVILRRASTQQLLIEAYHVPSDAHPDTVALGVLAAMLNERPAGLLYKRLVESKLAVSASAEVDSLHDPGFLTLSVTLSKDGDLDAVRRELAAIVAEVRTHEFPSEELGRVRDQQFNDYEKLLNSSAELATNLGENVALGDWRLLFWDRDLLHKVSVADAQRVANTYLIDSNRTTGEFIPDEHPQRTIVTAAPAIETLLAGYTGQAAVAPGEHFVATPDAIESRVKRGMAGTIKTAFLTKRTRGDRVSATLMLQFGDLASLKDKAQIGTYTAALLMRGTQAHTRQQIQDELTRLKATINIAGGANGLTLSFETAKDNLPQTVALATEILRSPSFPAADLDELKRASLARIDVARKDPNAVAQLAVQRSLSPYERGDFRYQGTLDERAQSISEVSQDDIKVFYQAFYGAGSAQAAFVGDLDPDNVTRQLTELLGTWKSASPYERAVAVYKPVDSKSDTLLTPDKPNAIFMVSSNLPLRDDDPNYAALLVANEVLGGGFLHSRLMSRIRQTDGLSYSLGSSVNVDSSDPVGTFTIYAICAPQNIGKVEIDVKEEIARAISDGFTPAEMAAAKSGLLQSRIVARSIDADLAGDLANHLFLGRDYQWDARFEAALQNATTDSINAALRRFIDPSKMITVKAGDLP